MPILEVRAWIVAQQCRYMSWCWKKNKWEKIYNYVESLETNSKTDSNAIIGMHNGIISGNNSIFQIKNNLKDTENSLKLLEQKYWILQKRIRNNTCLNIQVESSKVLHWSNWIPCTESMPDMINKFQRHMKPFFWKQT